MNKKYSKIKESLEKNGFEVYLFSGKEKINEFILKENNKDKSLYFGGSKTLDELKTYEYLNEKDINVNWHWREEEGKKNKTIYKNKIYITSSNAITEDGKLVNMDGIGNRVSSMITGYDKVYVLVGKNKIVENVEAGRERIKNIAAPLNAKRLERKTPCVKTGKCMDCDSSDRICCAEVVLHRNPMNSNVIICLIDENLGY